MTTRAYIRNVPAVFLLLIAALPALAARPLLLDVRVGPHKRFDRIVFEFAAAAKGQVTVKNAQQVDVRFPGVEVVDGFSLPALPSNLALIKGIEAFREGDGSVLFQISLTRDATPSQLPLPGNPWRLAVDLAPRVTTSENEDPKPEYVPGDLPIPTKFAEREPLLPDSMDPARVHAVLAYYYLSRGDTQRALAEAGLYQQLTGQTLDQLPQPGTPSPSPAVKTPRWQWLKITLPHIPLPEFGFLASLLAVFAAGLLGGFFLRHVSGFKLRSFRLSSPQRKLQRAAKERAAKEQQAELEQGLDALDEAVAAEPPHKAKATTKTKAESAPVPAPVTVQAAGAAAAPVLETSPESASEPAADAEQQAKESLMDRRVRRVLELNHEGRSIAEIAEELQMGQDEVKLILDLNK